MGPIGKGRRTKNKERKRRNGEREGGRYLMRTTNQIEIMLGQEFGDYVCAERVGNTAIVLAPAS